MELPPSGSGVRGAVGCVGSLVGAPALGFSGSREFGLRLRPNGADEQAGLVAPQLVQSPFRRPVAFIPVLPVLAAAAGATCPSLAAFAQPWHRSCAPLTSPGVMAWSAVSRPSLIGRGIQAVLPPLRCLKTFLQALVQLQ